MSGVDPPFDSRHYAASWAEKTRRALELGPRYYLLALPRYLLWRRRAGLPLFDPAALFNPLREFRRRRYHSLPDPPGLREAFAALSGAGVRMAMPRLRAEALAAAWWQTRDVAGDLIECGSYEGATALCLAVLCRHHGFDKCVMMLDTFAGPPAPDPRDGLRGAREFVPDGDVVARIRDQARALGVGDRIEIQAGLFGDSFRKLKRRPALTFSFVHVDANLYHSTRQACEFALPLLRPGGVAVFDDHNGVTDLGARLAIEEYLTPRGLCALPLAWSSTYWRRPS